VDCGHGKFSKFCTVAALHERHFRRSQIAVTTRLNPNSEVGEHTRPGCCWTRLASSLLCVCRTQKFWKFRCVRCFPRGRGKPHPRRVRSPATSEFGFNAETQRRGRNLALPRSAAVAKPSRSTSKYRTVSVILLRPARRSCCGWSPRHSRAPFLVIRFWQGGGAPPRHPMSRQLRPTAAAAPTCLGEAVRRRKLPSEGWSDPARFCWHRNTRRAGGRRSKGAMRRRKAAWRPRRYTRPVLRLGLANKACQVIKII
jgi:hypothetical protein